MLEDLLILMDKIVAIKMVFPPSTVKYYYCKDP